MEGAIRSGERAATDVIDALVTSTSSLMHSQQHSQKGSHRIWFNSSFLLKCIILTMKLLCASCHMIISSTTNKPLVRPTHAQFSSGPCKKRPGYQLSTLISDSLGRSHRSQLGKSRLKKCLDDTRRILGIPDDYLVGIVPGSDTGAYEMAMWNLLGK